MTTHAHRYPVMSFKVVKTCNGSVKINSSSVLSTLTINSQLCVNINSHT